MPAATSRRGLWAAVGVAVAFLLPVAGLAISSIVAPGGSSLEAERRAFVRYEEAIERTIKEGGFVVTQGMRPGVSDIQREAFPDETLRTMARSWVDSMRRVRSELAAVEPPPFLERTAALYDRALGAYVKAGQGLVAAAEATGEKRARLIKKVPPLGRRADELWVGAEASLARERERLGLDRAVRTPG